MEPYGDLCRPMGTHGCLLVPIGTVVVKGGGGVLRWRWGPGVLGGGGVGGSQRRLGRGDLAGDKGTAGSAAVAAC